MARGTLELLGTLSQRDLATALQELSAARAARETAESEWARAVERRRGLEELHAAEAGAERDRADQGAARVSDFTQAGYFEAALSERLKIERSHEGRALASLEGARAVERTAESALANARLGERAIEGRLARVAAVERTEREDASDEALEEAAAARRRGGP